MGLPPITQAIPIAQARLIRPVHQERAVRETPIARKATLVRVAQNAPNQVIALARLHVAMVATARLVAVVPVGVNAPMVTVVPPEPHVPTVAPVRPIPMPVRTEVHAQQERPVQAVVARLAVLLTPPVLAIPTARTAVPVHKTTPAVQ